MLHKDIRNCLHCANKQVANGSMDMRFWLHFSSCLEEIANQLELWERAAAIGETAKLQSLPDNVVRLPARRGKVIPIASGPTDGGAA